MVEPEKKKPFIIPIFIPHLGCPHQCVFCNQQVISGRRRTSRLSSAEISREIQKWLARKKDKTRPVELAFFGGSFTALPLEEQRRMLRAVSSYLEAGRIESIRLSTRPDAINQEICALLQDHGVRIVELGVQSLDDRVLRLSGRGHSVAQVERAFEVLHRFSFAIGGQLMLGLPGDSSDKIADGAEKLAALGPHFVRLYPTLVVQGSPLAKMYAAGHYRPLSLSRAIVTAAKVKDVFDLNRIKVIRMGLQEAEMLAAEIVAGPHHPAFGELVLSRQYYRRLRLALAGRRPGKKYILTVSAADQSVLRGQKNSNWRHLNDQGYLANVRVIFDRLLMRNDMDLKELTA
ncbi:MAG: radical SAM protein [Deltaproteobacteria bacterium]